MLTAKALLGAALGLVVVVLVGALVTPRWVFGSCGPIGLLAPQPSGAAPAGASKIGPVVMRLVQVQQQGTLAQTADQMLIELDGYRMPVTITADPCRVDAATAAVTASGGQVISSQDNVLYGLVPVAALPTLAQHREVLYIDLTSRQDPMQTLSG